MLKKVVVIFTISFLMVSVSGHAVHAVGEGDIIGSNATDINGYVCPYPKITFQEKRKQVVGFSSSQSYSPVGSLISSDWTIYAMQPPASPEENPIYSLEFTTNTDEQLNEYWRQAPSGFYLVTLTATNNIGISSTTENLILKGDISQQKYGFIAKQALKQLIRLIKSDAISYIPRAIANKLTVNVVPRLEKLLKYTAVYGEQVVGALIDGFMACGLSYAKSRAIAELIVAVFL